MGKIDGLPVRRPEVGCEVRRWRRERGVTLAEVASRSGLNIGYLSQIENDKASPSLEALAAIAASLDVPIAWFFLEGAPAPRLVRSSERRMVETGAGTAQEVDGGIPRDIRILESDALPGSRTGLHAHPGDEHHVVLAGRWKMTQGDHVFELGPGDYMLWDASIPHDVEVVGDEPGRMLMIYPRRALRAALSEAPAADLGTRDR